MTEIWFTFADGAEMRAAHRPGTVELGREENTPADTLYVTYFAPEPLFAREPWGMRVQINGCDVFCGVVDEHTAEEAGGVRRECFSGRSMAALLLDNEAMPGVLQMPSLRLLQKLYLEPLGLRAEGADLLPKKGQLTVERGMSCWDVLCDFAQNFLRCVPYCRPDGAVCFSAYEGKELRLKDVRRRTVTYRPRRKISRVVEQNTRTGAYSAGYVDLDASVPRVRYLAAQAETGPEAVFEKAKREALQMTFVCGGFLDAVPGDRVRADLPNRGETWLVLTQVRFHAEGGASETELVFAPMG